MILLNQLLTINHLTHTLHKILSCPTLGHKISWTGSSLQKTLNLSVKGYVLSKRNPHSCLLVTTNGNYGFIPSTLGGDGDPVDVITLDGEVHRGKFSKVRIIGAMDFQDGNQEDIKFIGLDPNGVFKGVESIEQLMFKHPAALEILKCWFSNYKGSGKMIFRKYLNLEQAKSMIAIAHGRWKKSRRME